MMRSISTLHRLHSHAARPDPRRRRHWQARTTRASLGAGAVRYSFTVTDIHRLPFAGLPAHPSTTSKSAAPRANAAEVPLKPCTKRTVDAVEMGPSGLQYSKRLLFDRLVGE